jgi:hypothetical protein
MVSPGWGGGIIIFLGIVLTVLLSMVVGDLDFEGIDPFPAKTNPVLQINPDAVLSFAIAAKRFQMMSGDCGEIGERLRTMQIEKFAQGHLLNLLKSFRARALKNLLSIGIPKGLNHVFILYRYTIKAKRKRSSQGKICDLLRIMPSP